MISRRWQRVVLYALVSSIVFGVSPRDALARKGKPNVVVIITDDQGYAELGVTGNPVVRTPHLDRLAARSASLANFQVMPVCSPTRAGLMTGRYAYRTGVVDTWMGRSLMDPEERTLAEMLRDHGYKTGIFGKWHLGDNYPRRAMDQGFEESLVLNGGGLAQPGDPPHPIDEQGAYFNATLSHNGSWIKTKGYISDVITEAACDFIQKHREQPFFAYLSFNCPHSPLQVPEKYRAHYPPHVFGATNFPTRGYPGSTNQNPDALSRVYGMIENIDHNVGQLVSKLEALKLAEDTIIVFLSDNGAQKHNGFNGGLRGWKGTPFEGGIHQFCFLQWPAQLKAGLQVDRITSHIDLAPTLLELCGVSAPRGIKLDGRSLAPLLQGKAMDWPDRMLVAQWHRGAVPDRYRCFSIRSQQWKLVQPLGREEPWDGRTEFQLYHTADDPFELRDVAAEHPDRVAALKHAYDRWFDDVTRERDLNKPQLIFAGSRRENPVLLTRQDWRGSNANWTAEGIGYWDVNILSSARYDINVRFDSAKADRLLAVKCGGVSAQNIIQSNSGEHVFKNVRLPAGATRLEATLQDGTTLRGVKYVELRKK